jgi:hypothetical protein
MLPSYLTPRFAHKVLFIGKAVQVLKRTTPALTQVASLQRRQSLNAAGASKEDPEQSSIDSSNNKEFTSKASWATKLSNLKAVRRLDVLQLEVRSWQ